MIDKKMKGITCCGDCVYYSMKKHRCTRGCKVEGAAQDHFYSDCPLPDVQPVEEAHTGRNVELYVRDRRTGKAHRVGDDQHDSIYVGEDGIVQYYNLQNGEGTLIGDPNEPQAGYEFVQTDDYGEVDDDTRRQAEEHREGVKTWKRHQEELAAQGITVIS